MKRKYEQNRKLIEKFTQMNAIAFPLHSSATSALSARDTAVHVDTISLREIM